jgi:uncharacterized membrane protein
MNELEPTDNPQHVKWGIFYYNRGDNRVLVPKSTKPLGWTFNFARPEVYYFIMIIVAIMWLMKRYG